GPGLFTDSESAPPVIHQQCTDIGNCGNAYPSQVDSETRLDKCIGQPPDEHIDPYQRYKQSQHQYEGQRQPFIMPGHYPQGIEDTGKAKEPSYARDGCLVRGGELDHAKNEKQDIDKSPYGESHTGRCEEVGVGIGEL